MDWSGPAIRVALLSAVAARNRKMTAIPRPKSRYCGRNAAVPRPITPRRTKRPLRIVGAISRFPMTPPAYIARRPGPVPVLLPVRVSATTSRIESDHAHLHAGSIRPGGNRAPCSTDCRASSRRSSASSRARGGSAPRRWTRALRQIRLALLEADVHIRVVRPFVDRLRERAVGQEVLASLTPAQQLKPPNHRFHHPCHFPEPLRRRVQLVCPPVLVVRAGGQRARRST